MCVCVCVRVCVCARVCVLGEMWGWGACPLRVCDIILCMHLYLIMDFCLVHISFYGCDKFDVLFTFFSN